MTTYTQDRIDALTRENDRLTATVKRQAEMLEGRKEDAVEIEALKAEIARLKAACDKFSESEMLQPVNQPPHFPEPDPQLRKFYGVETFPELIEAQARHIEKLQAKMPNTTGTFAVQKVREG